MLTTLVYRSEDDFDEFSNTHPVFDNEDKKIFIIDSEDVIIVEYDYQTINRVQVVID